MFTSKLWYMSVLLLSSQAYAATDLVRITKANFDAVLAQTDKPVIIDVFATWCGPCKQLKPVFHEFANKNADRYLCADLDADECKELMMSLGVKSLPTILVFQNKKCLGSFMGYKNHKDFTAAVEEVLTNGQKSLKELPKETLSSKFFDALQTCSIEDAKKLIEAGVDVNAPFSGPLAGLNPIILAILNASKFGDQGFAMFELLVNNGASLKEIEINGSKTTLRDFVVQVCDSAKKTAEMCTKALAHIDAKLQEQKCSGDVCKA